MYGKYVIVKGMFDIEVPILMGVSSNHNDFVDKAIAAGFFRIDRDKIYCWGESVTLGLKSREIKDSNLIRNAFKEN
jgi:hypothetical protein